MTKKQRGLFTVVLLLVVNIEYTWSEGFFPPYIYSKDTSFIFCLCYPSQDAIQQ